MKKQLRSYKDMLNIDNYIQAYEVGTGSEVVRWESGKLEINLYASSKKRKLRWKGRSLTEIQNQRQKERKGKRGVQRVVEEDVSKEKLIEIIETMKNGKFKFNPLKLKLKKTLFRIQNLRNIPSNTDKIIKQVYGNILKSIYYPLTLTDPLNINTGILKEENISVKMALKEVKKWKGITWMISGDLKGYNIDHHILVKNMSDRLDRNLIDFYWKLVKVGYININPQFSPAPHKYKYKNKNKNKEGVGGDIYKNYNDNEIDTLGPIISNIYLQKLDEYMDYLKAEYNTLNSKLLVNKIYYVRFGTQFLVGVEGTKGLCTEIKEKIKIYLDNKLKISTPATSSSSSSFSPKGEINTTRVVMNYNNNSVCKENMEIINIRKETVTFLGYNIKIINSINKKNTNNISEGGNFSSDIPTLSWSALSWSALSWSGGGGGREGGKGKDRVKLYISLDLVTKELESLGFCKEKQGIRMGKWINKTEYEILEKYRSVMLGLLEYYSLADNISRFNYISYLLTYSAAHTLAAKYKSTITKIFKKYGKLIEITHPENNQIINMNWKSYINK